MIVNFETCDDILHDPDWTSCFNCADKRSCFRNVLYIMSDSVLKLMWCNHYHREGQNVIQKP